MTASVIRKVVPSEEELLALIKRVRQENPQYSLCRVYIEVKSRKRDWKIAEDRVELVMRKYNMIQHRKSKIPEIPQIDKDLYIAFFTDDKEEVPVIKDTGKMEIPITINIVQPPGSGNKASTKKSNNNPNQIQINMPNISKVEKTSHYFT